VRFYTSRVDPTGLILTGYSDVNSWYNSLAPTLRRLMRAGQVGTLIRHEPAPIAATL
jgi:hypothetical protein